MLIIETITVGLPTALLSLARIAIILFPLLISLELATEFGWLKQASDKLSPLCQWLGLPPQAALPVVTGFIIGFTYSAGLILTSTAEGHWEEQELTRLWILLGLSHALIEDTAIFAALGLSPLILLLVRLTPTVFIMMGLNYYYQRCSSPNGVEGKS